MALYDMVVKVIVGDITETQDSSQAGTFAKDIKDYWDGLDSTTNAVFNFTSCQIEPGHGVCIIISDAD